MTSTLVPPAADPSPTSRAGSLLPVIRTIPEHCYENPTWKGLLAVAAMTSAYAAVLALLAITDAPWFVVPLWVLSALVLSGLFILAHDAAHHSLFASKRLDDVVGRILMLPMLHVYAGWVLGHNRIHHGHTVRQGVDFVWQPTTVDQYRAMSRLQRLRHRVEWGPLGAGLYYVREVWWNKMIAFDPPARHKRAIVRDRRIVIAFATLATVGLVASGTAIYGSLLGGVWLWLKLFAIPWFGFMWTIGWVVYVHHIAVDLEWWPRRRWNSFHGQVEGTTILRVPRLLNLFFLNIFVHVPHHVDMRIPWYHLPEAADAILAQYADVVDERPLRLRDYLHNVARCKLYDVEGRRWLPYSAAADAPAA